MSRPRATLAETRAVAREVQALRSQIQRLTVAVEQMRAAAPSQLGRVEDVCRILDISPATLHRRIADGTIPCIRHGRALRFDLAKLTTKNEAQA
jgi:transcriptional regulator of acetoin/glycerol metabolism